MAARVASSHVERDPVASLIDALDEGEGEMPEVVRRIVEVVVHALHVNGERVGALTRQLSARASQDELREVTDAVLADVRQSADAAHARHLDALEATQLVDQRLGARLEAASAASADALVALEASVLARVTERAASRAALDVALGRMDEMAARLERLEAAHVTPAQVATLSTRADDAGLRLIALEGARSHLESAVLRLTPADDHAALAMDVETQARVQRELLLALEAKAPRAELAEVGGRVRLLEERSAAVELRTAELPSARELRSVVEDRERLRALEQAHRGTCDELGGRVGREELQAALAPLASAAELNALLAALRQSRDEHSALAQSFERRLEAQRAEAQARAEGLEAAGRELQLQLAEAAHAAHTAGVAQEARAAQAGAEAEGARAELRRLVEASAQQAALHSRAVAAELTAELERRAVAADVRELWEETQAQLSALGAAGAQLRLRLEQAGAGRAASDEAAGAALGEARKLQADGRALHELLRRELHAKAGHAELHTEARRAAREAVEPLLSLQRAELDERAAELRKALAERAVTLRDNFAEELAELQRALRTKAALADVHAASAEVRGTLAATQEARLVELRAETQAATQEALGAFRQNVRRTLAHAAEELRGEVRDAVGGQVAEALALGQRQLEARVDAKADAQALALASLERALGSKAEAAELQRLEQALRSLEPSPGGEPGHEAVARLSSAVQLLAPAEELQRLRAEQRALLEPLWAETQVARWAWASHKLRSTGRSTLRLVPWEAQRINTDPQCFGWERAQPQLSVVQPGPYALAAAFFSRRRPLTIRLHVNGAPVLAKASDGQAKHIDASGRVAGVVLLSVIMLPRDAQLTVEFVGDEREATGILSLRKL